MPCLGIPESYAHAACIAHVDLVLLANSCNGMSTAGHVLLLGYYQIPSFSREDSGVHVQATMLLLLSQTKQQNPCQQNDE